MMRRASFPVLLLAFTACTLDVDAEPQSHFFGAADGEFVALASDAAERSFRAHLCRKAPEEVEIDVRLGAWAEAPEATEVRVTVTTPVGEHVETFAVDGRTRVDVEGIEPLVDAEATCDEGVGIRFELVEPQATEVDVEWALHFGFRAEGMLIEPEVELVDDP